MIKNLYILGITGLKQSGKSTMAEFVRDNFLELMHKEGMETDSYYLNFADALKDEICEALYTDIDALNELKKTHPPVRKLLQNWGTWRKESDPDYWIKKYDSCIQMPEGLLQDYPVLIITADVRFPNEQEYLIKLLGENYYSMRITRGSQEGELKDTHESETSSGGIKVDFTYLNNAGLEEMQHAAGSIAKIFIDKIKANHESINTGSL